MLDEYDLCKSMIHIPQLVLVCLASSGGMLKKLRYKDPFHSFWGSFKLIEVLTVKFEGVLKIIWLYRDAVR